MDSQSRRIIPPDIDQAVVEESLKFVVRYFSSNWLSQPELHPIRVLWNSMDAIATCQLLWLGSSLKVLSAIDSRWVDDAVSKMKSNQENRSGFAFELLVLPMFVLGGHTVIPAKPGQAGYDADIGLASGKRLRVSLKNFGATKHAKAFEKDASELHDVLEKKATEERLDDISLTAIGNRYPRTKDWISLQNVFKTLPGTSDGEQLVGDVWHLIASWKVPDPGVGSPGLTSSIAIITPQHENEKKNFLDKIASECGAFSRLSEEKPANMLSAVIFRLSEAAPLTEFAAWAKEYINRERTHLDGVIFMHTAVTFEATTGETSMTHHVTPVWKDGLESPDLKMTAIVGRISPDPIREILTTAGGNFSLAGMHWYYRSERFVRSQMKSDGSIAVEIPPHPPGTVVRGILEVPGGGSIILSSRHKMSEKVALYS